MSQSRSIAMFIVGSLVVVGVATGVNWGLTSSLIASGAFVGAAGADGAPGLDGAVGATGPQGPQGPQGERGADGASGGIGHVGATGAGAQGAAGAVGAPGPQGAPGAPGTDGTDGTDAPVVEPVVATFGAGSQSLVVQQSFQLTGGISLDPGVYALTFSVTGMTSAVAAGYPFGSVTCSMAAGGAVHAFVFAASSGPSTFPLSAVVALSAPETVGVTCIFSYWALEDTVLDVTWTGGSISAVRLD